MDLDLPKHIYSEMRNEYCDHRHIKREGNFQNNLSPFNFAPSLLSKYIGEKAHNPPKAKLLALKYTPNMAVGGGCHLHLWHFLS